MYVCACACMCACVCVCMSVCACVCVCMSVCMLCVRVDKYRLLRWGVYTGRHFYTIRIYMSVHVHACTACLVHISTPVQLTVQRTSHGRRHWLPSPWRASRRQQVQKYLSHSQWKIFLFFTPTLLELIVEQTNKYAAEYGSREVREVE